MWLFTPPPHCASTPHTLPPLQVAIFDMMDPQARQDCLKEVRILQNLEHPNIVKCFNSYIQARERASRTGSHWRAVRESHH